MNLARKGPSAGYGALLGALGGFLLNDLGASYVMGSVRATTFILVGLLIGAAIGLAVRAVILAAIDGALVVLWLVVAYSPIMAHVASGWVRRDALPPGADALMVLSSSVRSDSALDPNGTERLLSGLELAKATHVPEFVTSRVWNLVNAGRISSDSDQKRLLGLTDFGGHWDVVFPVRSTRDEALRAAKLLLPARSHLVVVTSPMHTRRACGTFERVGFSVSCQPARERDHVTWHPETSPDRLAAFREYVYERLGMMKYRYEGWVRN